MCCDTHWAIYIKKEKNKKSAGRLYMTVAHGGDTLPADTLHILCIPSRHSFCVLSSFLCPIQPIPNSLQCVAACGSVAVVFCAALTAVASLMDGARRSCTCSNASGAALHDACMASEHSVRGAKEFVTYIVGIERIQHTSSADHRLQATTRPAAWQVRREMIPCLPVQCGIEERPPRGKWRSSPRLT